MKLMRFVSFLLCFALLLSVPLSVAAEEAAGAASEASEGTYSLDSAVAYLSTSSPVENATAVFLYETNTDTLMYAQSPDMQIYPSSLVKILTALLAVERGELSETVTVDAQVLAEVPYDAVSAELQEGEQLSLNDLLYCMMVGSANDAAAVIAQHIGGSQSDFVEEMNRYAEELGCSSTRFTNPHGLHDPEQYSTVRDMTRILAAATANETFMTYFSTVHYTVPATNLSEERELSSKNFLMNNDGMEIYYDPRVTGGRTGVSDDGTSCLAVSAESDGLSLVCVLVGAESVFADDGRTTVYGGFKETTALFDSVFGVYSPVQVLYEGQTLRQYAVVNGANHVVAGSDAAVTAILPTGTTVAQLDYRYRDAAAEFQAPVSCGEKLSEVEVWYGNLCVARADLLAMNAVSAFDPASTVAEPDRTGEALKILGTAVLLVVLAAFAVLLFLYVLRWINMRAERKRTKRYRRNRRRSR